MLAITGYLGSGMTSLAEQLKARLEKLPEHEGGVSSIKASGLLEAEARKRGEVIPNGSRYERTQWLQQFGDTLRAEHGTAVVAGLIIREMKAKRRSDANGQAFIIDCCKHPEEVAVLRDVYGSGFFLIGMICDLETRKTNLRRKFHGDATEEQIEEIIDTDAKEEMDWGQHARKTLPMADYFVSQQEGGALVSIDKQIERLLELVLGTAVHRPNRDERGMYAAWGAALRSSCLSRQVGAAIINQQGIVIATGTNDVPAPGGGIYPSNNSDARCHLPIEGPPGRDIAIGQKRSIELRVLGSKKTAAGNAPLPFCRNDFVKEALWVDVTEKLNKLIDSTSCPPLTKDAVKDALRQTLIRDLVEFSRALHAEADALISLARAGGPSCQGASLYVTLFPCHLCTRQVIAAGIAEVVYIEPYPKSLALVLHDDAVRDSEQPANSETSANAQPNKVVFRLFNGVAPRRYADLFESHPEQKEATGFMKKNVRRRPLDPLFRKSHIELEKTVAEKFDEVFGGSNQKAGSASSKE